MIFEGKKHIIFDWDGTLVNSIPMWQEADIKMLENLGKVARPTLEREKKRFFEKNPKGDIYLEYNQFLIDSYGIENMTPELLNLERFKVIMEASKEIDLKKDAEVFLALLRKYGFTLSISTLSTRSQMNYYKLENPNIRRKTDSFEIFNGVMLTKDDVENKKPHPEIYLKAIELLGAKRDEVLVLEDSLIGVLAAKRAKLETLSIYDKHNEDDLDRISRYADHEARDYKSLIKMFN